MTPPAQSGKSFRSLLGIGDSKPTPQGESSEARGFFSLCSEKKKFFWWVFFWLLGAENEVRFSQCYVHTTASGKRKRRKKKRKKRDKIKQTEEILSPVLPFIPVPLPLQQDKPHARPCSHLPPPSHPSLTPPLSHHRFHPPNNRRPKRVRRRRPHHLRPPRLPARDPLARDILAVVRRRGRARAAPDPRGCTALHGRHGTGGGIRRTGGGQGGKGDQERAAERVHGDGVGCAPHGHQQG